MEAAEESGLNSPELAGEEFAVDVFLATLARAIGQDVSAADFVFADFFVCPGARGGDNMDVVFLANAVAQGTEELDDGVDGGSISIVMLPFDYELQRFGGVDDDVGPVDGFCAEHGFWGEWHLDALLVMYSVSHLEDGSRLCLYYTTSEMICQG